MIVEVKIPEVGESVTEGLLAEWLKADGDSVLADEALFELETDKVTMTIPAELPGRLQILVVAGETVPVGTVVGKIDTAASAQPSQTPIQPEAAAAHPTPVALAAPSVATTSEGPPIAPAAGMAQAQSKLSAEEPMPLSPAVRHLLAEHDLPAASIKASGKGGRLTKNDVLLHMEKGSVAPSYQAQAVEAKDETRVKMSPLRHRITERLVQVQQTAAILTTFNQVDMSAVMDFRAKHKQAFEKKFDVRLGFMSFFVKAAVDALKTVPEINARIEGDDIVYQHYFHIGVAVGTEQGLVVPVIRDADRQSFAQIEAQISDMATRARSHRLKLEELLGGCFTISNGGVYGSLMSTPILNPPQSGILGLHRIEKRPMVVNDEIVIRPMMYLALSYDHRVVDGSQAVTFLKRIVDCMEDPQRMLLEV